MRLGFSSTEDERQDHDGMVISTCARVQRLAIGAIIRNGCDTNDPPEKGVYMAKVPSTRAAGGDQGSEWAYLNPATKQFKPWRDAPIRSIDLRLPVQVMHTRALVITQVST